MKRVHLTRCMSLEAAQRAADGAGGFTETWQKLGTLWAEIKPRSGRLSKGETDALSVTAYKITVRASPIGKQSRPAPGQRFRMSDRVFRIESVTEYEPRGLYLICQCEEEQAT